MLGPPTTIILLRLRTIEGHIGYLLLPPSWAQASALAYSHSRARMILSQNKPCLCSKPAEGFAPSQLDEKQSYQTDLQGLRGSVLHPTPTGFLTSAGALAHSLATLLLLFWSWDLAFAVLCVPECSSLSCPISFLHRLPIFSQILSYGVAFPGCSINYCSAFRHDFQSHWLLYFSPSMLITTYSTTGFFLLFILLN